MKTKQPDKFPYYTGDIATGSEATPGEWSHDGAIFTCVNGWEWRKDPLEKDDNFADGNGTCWLLPSEEPHELPDTACPVCAHDCYGTLPDRYCLECGWRE